MGANKATREQGKPPAINILLDSDFRPVSRQKLALLSILPLVAVALEASMLILFLHYYIALKPNPKTGERPRLSPWYSIWPFICSIGGARLPLYRAMSLLSTFLLLVANSLSLYWNLNVKPGYYLRRIQYMESSTATVLSISLFYFAQFLDNRAHVIITSVRLALLFAGKCTYWALTRKMRNTYKALHLDPGSSASYFGKIILMGFALPFCLLANIGTFSCWDPLQIHKQGTTCYRLDAAAAVSDWCYAVVNMSFLIILAYDLYHDTQAPMLSSGTLPGGDAHLEAQMTAMSMPAMPMSPMPMSP